MEKAIHVNKVMALPPEVKDIKSFYRLETLQVTTDAEVELAGQALKEVKHRLKLVEEKRKEVVGPIKQGIAAFEAMCREVTNPLKEIDRALRAKVERFWQNRQRKLEEEAKKEREAKLEEERRRQAEAIETAMETGSETAMKEAEQREKNAARLEAKPIEVKQTFRSSTFTLAQAKRFTWTVTDLAKVPREYLVLDEKRLNSIAKRYKTEKVEIPGIEFRETSTSVLT